jgi:pSer/pThr/pTyr-binding forkhead associated (FHA) protein
MLPILVEQGGTKPEDLHLLDRRETTIGRDSRSNIVIPDSRVSRKHAIIAYENLSQVDRPPSCILYDAGSRNGTYLNGARIEKPASLKEADQIVIGGRVFHFCAFKRELSLRNTPALASARNMDILLPIRAFPSIAPWTIRWFSEQTFIHNRFPTARTLSCKASPVTNHFTRDMYFAYAQGHSICEVHLFLSAHRPGNESSWTRGLDAL